MIDKHWPLDVSTCFVSVVRNKTIPVGRTNRERNAQVRVATMPPMNAPAAAQGTQTIEPKVEVCVTSRLETHSRPKRTFEVVSLFTYKQKTDKSAK